MEGEISTSQANKLAEKIVALVNAELGPEWRGEYAGGTIETDRTRFTLRIRLAAMTEQAQAARDTNAEQEWQMGAGLVGLPADAFGREFNYRGTVYRITGLSLNRPKYPVNVVRVHDQKAFKFPASTVERQLLRTNEEAKA